MKVVTFLLLAGLAAVVDSARKRHLSSFALAATRDESSPSKCRRHEYHVICGPERHCERSCDNLFSPPYCAHDDGNPKCYFPRCLCVAGYVRDQNGRCIRPRHCQANSLDQAMGMLDDAPDGGMSARSLPHAPRHRLTRHERHQRRARLSLKTRKAIKEDDQDRFFW